MKVLVRFKGDNDFGSVLRAFGTLLLARVERGEDASPLQVQRWFNELAPTLYEMVQSREPETHLAKTRTYLRIGLEDVYIDAAADEKMKTAHQWANYDSVMVDSSEHAREKVYLV
jgi:hypothetical protein